MRVAIMHHEVSMSLSGLCRLEGLTSSTSESSPQRMNCTKHSNAHPLSWQQCRHASLFSEVELSVSEPLWFQRLAHLAGCAECFCDAVNPLGPLSINTLTSVHHAGWLHLCCRGSSASRLATPLKVGCILSALQSLSPCSSTRTSQNALRLGRHVSSVHAAVLFLVHIVRLTALDVVHIPGACMSNIGSIEAL